MALAERRDEQLLFVAGVEPIRCGRPIYFRRPEMVKLCAENRFAKPGAAANDPAGPNRNTAGKTAA